MSMSNQTTCEEYLFMIEILDALKLKENRETWEWKSETALRVILTARLGACGYQAPVMSLGFD